MSLEVHVFFTTRVNACGIREREKERAIVCDREREKSERNEGVVNERENRVEKRG